jgi:hypothetical protein
MNLLASQSTVEKLRSAGHWGHAVMNHGRCLGFETLEARMLLSRGHALAHARAAVIATPLQLNGTLAVDAQAAILNMNVDGSTTSETPVAGQLGSLGEVHGTWYESFDEYGDYLGPDTVSLHNSKGTIVIAFNDQKQVRTHKTAHGPISYVYAQRVQGGSGAYAHAAETGTIELTTGGARKNIQSMEIQTGNR